MKILEWLNGTNKEDESEKSTKSVERLLASHPDTAIRLKAFRHEVEMWKIKMCLVLNFQMY